MSNNGQHPQHGQIGYLQLPTINLDASIAFYRAVFGWVGEAAYASFEAPGLIGQWVTDRVPAAASGPVVWICVDQLGPALELVAEHGGRVTQAPMLDQGERWLAEVDDSSGNRIGIVAAVRSPQSQTLIAVRDVEASSRWYQQLLGFVSNHGGPHYEQLLSNGDLALQLHAWDIEHDHGAIGDAAVTPGNGVLLWFGDVADFDAVVERARQLDATVVLAPHRNPPSGEGNGPAHRELWIKDLDGYTVVVASPDGEALEWRAILQ